MRVGVGARDSPKVIGVVSSLKNHYRSGDKGRHAEWRFLSSLLLILRAQ